MLDLISQLAKNLAVTIVVISILEMLLPDNKTKKYVKTVFGLVIVINIVAPFVGTQNMGDLQSVLSQSTSIEFNDMNFEDILEADLMTNKINNIYITEIEKDMIEKIEEMGYNVDKIDLSVNIHSDDYMEKVELGVSKGQEQTKKSNAHTLEAKLEIVVEKIEPVVIGNSAQSVDESKIELACTTLDIETISKFIIQEYGVDKKCLEIKSTY